MHKLSKRNLFVTLLVGASFSILSLLLHILPSFNSMINFKDSTGDNLTRFFSDDYIGTVVNLHKDHPVFARRPLTTFFTDLIADYTFLSIAESFSLVNFSLIFFSGLLVFYIARLLKYDYKESLLSLILFCSSFTILLPFFRTTYTYDEPFQYFFFLLTLVALLEERWLFFLLSFFLSLLGRETSAIAFLGVYLFMLIDIRKITIDKLLIKNTLVVVVPILGYVLYYLFTNDSTLMKDYDETNVRLSQFQYNFQDYQYTKESLSLFLITLGIPFYSLVWYLRDHPIKGYEKKILNAFWFVFILNTIIIIISVRVNESRVIALPLLLLWPLAGKYFRHLLSDIKNKIKTLSLLYLFSINIFFAFISYFIAFEVYQPTGSLMSENLFNEYFFGLLLFVGFHLSVKLGVIISNKH